VVELFGRHSADVVSKGAAALSRSGPHESSTLESSQDATSIWARMGPLIAEFTWGSSLGSVVPIAAIAGLFGVLIFALGIKNRRPSLLALALLLVAASALAAMRRDDFSIGGGALRVTTFGLALTTGLFGAAALSWRAARKGFPGRQLRGREAWSALFVAAVAGSFVGARVTSVSLAQGSWDELFAAFGGLSLAGAWMGGATAFSCVCRFRRLPFRWALDVVGPSVLVVAWCVAGARFAQGSGFGGLLSEGSPELLRRWGTFERWNTDWGFGDGPPVLLAQEARELIAVTSDASLPAHPLPLYEMLGVTLLALALGLLSKKLDRAGERGLVAIGGYASIASVTTLLTQDLDATAWSPGVSLAVVAAAVLAFLGGRVSSKSAFGAEGR
jgi:prolipoprotein diacylglyceryltransferase